MNMLEGFRKLYTGKDAFQRHITLFSICGTLGLFEAYVQMNPGVYENIILSLFAVLFMFFFCGYETLFLRERELPDIDYRAFKLAMNRIIFIVFLIGVPIYLSKFFPRYSQAAFIIELLLAVPLTSMQAGFSYNFEESEAFSFIKNFKFGDYIMLILKRLWVIICCYVFVFVTVFTLFFIAGFVIVFITKGDVADMQLIISSQQDIIFRLSNYLAMIVMVYMLTIGTLVWDYELITMKERKDEID